MLLFLLISLGIVALVGAFFLPWLMVRAGQKEVVGVACFCSGIAGLAALSSVAGTDGPLLWLLAGSASFGVLYALNCGLPLWLTRKK